MDNIKHESAPLKTHAFAGGDLDERAEVRQVQGLVRAEARIRATRKVRGRVKDGWGQASYQRKQRRTAALAGVEIRGQKIYQATADEGE